MGDLLNDLSQGGVLQHLPSFGLGDPRFRGSQEIEAASTMMMRRTPAVRRSALSVLLDDASTFIDASGSNTYDYGSGMATESGQRRSLRVAQRAQPTMGSGWNGSGRRYSLRVASKVRQQQQQAVSSVSFDGPVALISSSWSLREEVARHRSRQLPTQSEEVVSDDNSIDIDWNPSNHLECRRMSNGPLSFELCRARDIYMTKRERCLQVIGQLQHQWKQRECREQHKLKQFKVLEQVKKGFNGIQLNPKKSEKWLQRPMGEKEFKGQLKKAIKSYTGKDYEIINLFLRTGRIKPGKEKYIGLAEQARRALNVGLRWEKHLLKRFESDMTLYRGSGNIPMELEAGATFCDKAFLSTSQLQFKALTFLNLIDRSETRILFAITRHCTGVDVSAFSKNKHESEVLFAPDTMFRIIAVDKERTVDGLEGTVTFVEIQEMV